MMPWLARQRPRAWLEVAIDGAEAKRVAAALEKQPWQAQVTMNHELCLSRSDDAGPFSGFCPLCRHCGLLRKLCQSFYMWELCVLTAQMWNGERCMKSHCPHTAFAF